MLNQLESLSSNSLPCLVSQYVLTTRNKCLSRADDDNVAL